MKIHVPKELTKNPILVFQLCELSFKNTDVFVLSFKQKFAWHLHPLTVAKINRPACHNNSA